MTPEDRRAIFEQRDAAAIVKGVTGEDGDDIQITGKTLGQAIVFVSEGAATDAASAHVVYGDNASLSYTDCLSVYRDYGQALQEQRSV